MGCEKQNQKEKEKKKKKVVWDERKNIKKRKRRRHTMDKSWLTVGISWRERGRAITFGGWEKRRELG